MFDALKKLRHFLGVWRGGAYAEENVSGMARSVVHEIYLFISTFFHVVLPMFDPAHYWGPYLGLQGPPAAGGPGRHPYLFMEGYTI